MFSGGIKGKLPLNRLVQSWLYPAGKYTFEVINPLNASVALI